MNKIKAAFIVLCCVLASCTSNSLIDINQTVDENNWTYAKSLKATVNVTDISKAYNVYFKLRHTDDYRYANIFVLFSLKGSGFNKHLRYQFKLAKPDGEWLGKGSGAIFANNFVLLSNYHFTKPGVYTIEIEQNMRDNPLIGISDLGVEVSTQP